MSRYPYAPIVTMALGLIFLIWGFELNSWESTNSMNSSWIASAKERLRGENLEFIINNGRKWALTGKFSLKAKSDVEIHISNEELANPCGYSAIGEYKKAIKKN